MPAQSYCALGRESLKAQRSGSGLFLRHSGEVWKELGIWSWSVLLEPSLCSVSFQANLYLAEITIFKRQHPWMDETMGSSHTKVWLTRYSNVSLEPVLTLRRALSSEEQK